MCQVGTRGRLRTPRPLRPCADRRHHEARQVALIEELGDEQDGDDEGQLRAAVEHLAVGVATELAVVRQPRVGALDDPPATERDRQLPRLLRLASSTHGRGDHPVDADLFQLPADTPIVVSAVDVQRLDLREQALVVDGLQRVGQEAPCHAGWPAPPPSRWDALGVGGDRPLPAELPPINWAFARAFPAAGGLVERSVDDGLGGVEADLRCRRRRASVSTSWSKTPASIHSSRRARRSCPTPRCRGGARRRPRSNR